VSPLKRDCLLLGADLAVNDRSTTRPRKPFEPEAFGGPRLRRRPYEGPPRLGRAHSPASYGRSSCASPLLDGVDEERHRVAACQAQRDGVETR